MPRVTSAEQYRRYKFLHTAWREFDVLYAAIDTAKQRDLHAFYRPSETLTKAQFIQHIDEAGRRDLSLPQRAGTYVGVLERLFLSDSLRHGIDPTRARSTIETVYFTKYDARLLAKPAVSEPYRRQGHKQLFRVTARPVARPDPDYAAIARALLKHYLESQ